MGALPKRRISTQRKGKRRSDKRKNLQLKQLIACKKCGADRLSHQACPTCETY